MLPFPQMVARLVAMTESGRAELLGLAKKVVAVARDHVHSGKAAISQFSSIRTICDELQFRDCRPTPTRFSQQIVAKPWWDESKFAETAIETLPEYASCLSLISRLVESDEATRRLNGFCRALCRLSLEPEVPESLLFEQTAEFAELLDGCSELLQLCSWLHGIVLAESRYDLGGGIVLRHPNKADFSFENTTGGPSHDLLSFPTAILEYKCRAPSPHLDQEEVYSSVECLRLFALGSVRVCYTRGIHRCHIMHGDFQVFPPRQHSFYEYKVGTDDLTPLKTFIAAIHPLLLPLRRDRELANSPLRLALDRYWEGLLTDKGADLRIMQAISCLDALLTRSGRQEGKHCLGQRVAALLGLADVGVGRPEIYKHVTTAYDIRNKFVHGEPYKKGNVNTKEDEARAILDYARICLLLCLQLGLWATMPQKEAFLDDLDASLLDGRVRNDLELKVKGLLLGKH